MIELFGEVYYIDFAELDKILLLDKDAKGSVKKDGVSKIITKDIVEVKNEHGILLSTETTTREHIKHKEIDGVRFEIIRNFISDIGDESFEEDPKLGEHGLDKTSIRFKLAFNTLLAYDILKKLE
jgi:hypothetical protein|tara:strand:- start:9386 stop:9760 length:375 start_codon:yes stop_codon:yes gene_type:complete